MSYVIEGKADADAIAWAFDQQHNMGCKVYGNHRGGGQGYVIRTATGRALWLNGAERSILLRAHRARAGR